MKFGESEQEDKDYKRITQFVYKDINEEPGEGGFLEELNLGKSSSYRSVGAKVTWSWSKDEDWFLEWGWKSRKWKKKTVVYNNSSIEGRLLFFSFER